LRLVAVESDGQTGHQVNVYCSRRGQFGEGCVEQGQPFVALDPAAVLATVEEARLVHRFFADEGVGGGNEDEGGFAVAIEGKAGAVGSADH